MKEAPKVYLARAGRRGEDEEFALENNLAIFGLPEVPSAERAKDYYAVAKLVEDGFPGRKPRSIGNLAGQLWAFTLLMQEDDIVVLPRKLTSQIAIGRVRGPYRYIQVNGVFRHTRPVEWLRPDVPRATFEQDLLKSFGALQAVCTISRNDAAWRVEAVLQGKPDPGPPSLPDKPTDLSPPTEDQTEGDFDLAQLAHDQIVAKIQERFTRHELTRLVDAVLQADGWVTSRSPPGPDGGVDILAGRGPLGLDAPRLCVQVKSQTSPADVTVYRTLQGTMQTFKAEQGLLVCWGGFNQAVLQESRQSHFVVRLWDSGDLVAAIYRNYEQLPAEIQAELPLKRVWMLVAEESEE